MRHIESISALRGGDENPLPADVTQTILQALNLSTEEKLRILLLLQNPDGVSIATMRDYISKHFKDFEMIASALGSSQKHKPTLPLPRLKPVDITAKAATLHEDKEPEVGINCEMGSPRKRANLEARPALPSVGGREERRRVVWVTGRYPVNIAWPNRSLPLTTPCPNARG